MTSRKAALGAVTMVSVLAGSSVAAAAPTTPTPGKVKVFVEQ
jgi:hypothetical protein